jgi:hypothetical protein
LEYWQSEHSVARAIAPNAYQSLAQIEGERLGLVPAGTLAQNQHAYDQQALGLAPLTGSAILRPTPGIAPIPSSAYLPLPPGAGYAPPTNPTFSTVSPYPLPPGAVSR